MPATDRSKRKFQVLGMHGNDVHTVEGNVARVRMFIDGKAIDEDFSLPRALSVEEQLETAVLKRITELEGGNQ